MDLYSAKLTAEPFLYPETKIIAEYILNGCDENELKIRNINENLIRYKSVKSISRVNSPIFRRIDVMTKNMLEVFVNGDIQTSKLILLYSIMKTDNLVKDFLIEIYKDKVLLGKEYIEKVEVDDWFNLKMLNDKSLSEKSETTKSKLKQVLMKIIHDSGLVSKEKERFKINKIMLKSNFKDLLKENHDETYTKIFGGML